MRLTIDHYVSPGGNDPFQQWLDSLQDLHCRVAILRRIDRLAMGNAGDRRFCRDGVWEMRVNCGPGYRVYFARTSRDRVLLLGGGPKATQRIDIEQAVARRHEYEGQP